MQNFQDSFETRKRSFISVFSVCMTVPLISFLTKTFSLCSGTLDKKQILPLAPTGVAALNNDGTTIHSGFGINPNCNTYTMGKLSEALKAKLRCDYSEIVAVVIDEISMVSNIRLFRIHKRVCEIFGCSENCPQ